MSTRYVLLRFDDGDRFDYEPPLTHSADIFLERLKDGRWFSNDVGATSAIEVPTHEVPPKQIDLLSPTRWRD